MAEKKGGRGEWTIIIIMCELERQRGLNRRSRAICTLLSTLFGEAVLFSDFIPRYVVFSTLIDSHE